MTVMLRLRFMREARCWSHICDK